MRNCNLQSKVSPKHVGLVMRVTLESGLNIILQQSGHILQLSSQDLQSDIARKANRPFHLPSSVLSLRTQLPLVVAYNESLYPPTIGKCLSPSDSMAYEEVQVQQKPADIR